MREKRFERKGKEVWIWEKGDKTEWNDRRVYKRMTLQYADEMEGGDWIEIFTVGLPMYDTWIVCKFGKISVV